MNNFKPSNNSLDIPWIESPFFNQLLEESDLTDKQKEDCKFYNENGYLVIDLGLTDDEISPIVNDMYSALNDEKTKYHVAPFVNGREWEFEVLLDPNGDFKRAMGVNDVPHTFLIDKEGNIVYSHNNYAPGDEEKLLEEIKKLGAK